MSARTRRGRLFVEVPEIMVGFDTETTGLSSLSDRAISYGFVVCEAGDIVSEEHFYVDPEIPISAGAERVHGISADQLATWRAEGTALSFSAGVNRAVAILSREIARGAVLVGANVALFDLAMLSSNYQWIHQAPLSRDIDLRRVDIADVVAHDLAMEPREVSSRRRGLPALCQHYGVTPGGHDALGDARAAVEVFIAQVRQNRRLMNAPRLADDPNDPVEDARRWLEARRRKVVG